MSSSNSIKYKYKGITTCNMCNSDVTNHENIGERLNCHQGLNPKKKEGICVKVYRCSNCGVVYSNPMPIPESIQDHYGVPPESYWNKQNFEMPAGYFKAELDQLESIIGDLRNKKALDIGAGLGLGMVAMQLRGMDVYGIEASVPFYKRAIEKMNISKDKLKCELIENTDYKSNSFDFVNFGAVLEHFYDPSECILKGMRWLKQGGIMYIEVPSSNYLVTKLLNKYYRIRGMSYVSNLSPMHPPFHLHEFLEKSFITHSVNNKNLYSIVRCKYIPCTAYMPGILDKLLIWYMEKTKTGMQLCIFLKKN